MSNAILFRMPSGIQGDITRQGATVEAQPLNSALPFPTYGVPGKIVAGAFVPVTTTGDVIYGFLVRPYPTTGLNASDPLGTSVPVVSGVANVLRRGYLSVVCNVGAPALGGVVYVRVAAPVAGQPIGGIEATTSVNNYLLTAANGAPVVFTGPADAAGNCEIAFNI